MIKFNPKNKPSITAKDLIDPMAELSSQEEADEYLYDYSLFLWGKSVGIPLDEVKEQALNNISYLMGYYSDDDIHDNIWKYYKIYPSIPKGANEAYNKGLEHGKAYLESLKMKEV